MALDFFNLKEGLIITGDQEKTIQIDKYKIEIKPAYKVMLENKLTINN